MRPVYTDRKKGTIKGSKEQLQISFVSPKMTLRLQRLECRPNHDDGQRIQHTGSILHSSNVG